MKVKKRILVAPLDWGIGHATRCIPIIKALIAQNFEVVIAADNRPLHLLTTEFPDLEVIRFSGYNVKYSTYLPMSLNMIFQIPKILLGIKREHKMVEQIIEDYKNSGLYQLRGRINIKQLSRLLQGLNYKIANRKYNYINSFDVRRKGVGPCLMGHIRKLNILEETVEEQKKKRKKSEEIEPAFKKIFSENEVYSSDSSDEEEEGK